eukprot:4626173-Prymnesium_polylepis.2
MPTMPTVANQRATAAPSAPTAQPKDIGRNEPPGQMITAVRLCPPAVLFGRYTVRKASARSELPPPSGAVPPQSALRSPSPPAHVDMGLGACVGDAFVASFVVARAGIVGLRCEAVGAAVETGEATGDARHTPRRGLDRKARSTCACASSVLRATIRSAPPPLARSPTR